MTDREQFGLWLNQTRVFYRRAHVVVMAIHVALSGETPPGWWNAICDNPEEAKEAENQAEFARVAKGV